MFDLKIILYDGHTGVVVSPSSTNGAVAADLTSGTDARHLFDALELVAQHASKT